MSAEPAIAGDGAATAAAARIVYRPHPSLPWLLAPEGVALQVLMDTTPVRVPNTRPWFRGVVSQRGILLPVFDPALWSGRERDAGSRVQIVAVALGAQACALVCDDPPTLTVLGAELHSAEAEGPLSPWLGRTFASALGSVHEFDIRRWLADTAQHIAGTTDG
jgi:chemotaxis signal transduction protein